MAVCRYHPDRTGIGICMRCRSVICAACTTKVDGVNHCHACLRALGTRDAAPSRAVGPGLAAVVLLGCGGALCFGLAWLMQGLLAP